MKQFRKFASTMLAVAAIAGLTACEDEKNEQPDPENPTISQGMYVLNNGNKGKKIEGDITYYDYATGKASQDMFQKANGRSLGQTPQGAVIYGSKIYVGVYESNAIEIIDRYTLKSIKQIKLEGRTASEPRSLVVRDGNVYISMYTGWISRMDTITCEINDSVKVGPNPDIIAIHGSKLYVPNSDGMNWKEGYGTTATEIDLATFKATRTFDVPLNPCQFLSSGDNLYLLSKGNYGDVKSIVYRFDPEKLTSTPIHEATNIAARGNSLFIINAPYGVPTVDYKRYDASDGKIIDMLRDNADGVDSPAGIEVDPFSGDIFITSYVMDGGKASYVLPGYCKIYDRNGVYKNRFETGVGPTLLFPSVN